MHSQGAHHNGSVSHFLFMLIRCAGHEIKGGFVFASVLSELQPDFAVLLGDMIYADNPIPFEKEIPEELGGGIWTNHVPKDFTAIAVDEFRNNWKYNLGDEKWAEFLRNTPVFVEWDDHEVTNNWYPGEILPEDPYMSMPASDLAERALQALNEFNPVKDNMPMWKSVQFGKHLEMFITDARSFRSAAVPDAALISDPHMSLSILDGRSQDHDRARNQHCTIVWKRKLLKLQRNHCLQQW